MGQFTSVSSPGITVTPIDRETGPGAGPGTSGNRDIYLGLNSAANSTANDSIVLGNHAGDGGMASANLDGTIIIGSQAARSLIASQTVPDSAAGNIIMGLRAASALVYGNGNIILGQDTLTEAPGLAGAAEQDNVHVGHYIAQFGSGRFTENVIIGHKAGRMGTVSVPHTKAINASVIIGSGAANGANAANLTGLVVIGYLAGQALGTALQAPTNHTIIGTQAGASLQGGSDVTLIGPATNCRTQTVYAVGIGSNAITDDSCVTVGWQAGGFAGGGGRPGLGCIAIGAGAGGQLTNGSAWQLIVESFDQAGFVRHAGIYGDLLHGNIVLGDSTVANGRDFGGGGTLNAIKILPGSGAGGAPASGGYFYYDAATGLHFIGAAGTDTPLAPP